MQDLPFVPVVYLVKLVEMMEEEHLHVDYIFRECGISRGILAKPDVYLTAEQTQAIIQKFLGLTALPFPGIRYGLRLDLITHGLFGFVYTYRGNFRDLYDHIICYLRVRFPLVSIQLDKSQADYFAVKVECKARYPELEIFFTQAFLTSLYKLGSLVTRNVSIHWKSAILADTRATAALLPVEQFTDAPETEIRFYLAESATPAATAHIPGEQAAPETDTLEASVHGLVVKMRQYILTHASEPLSAEDVASHFGMSVRTLRRHLAESGFNFQQIRLEVRMNVATRYLTTSHVSIERIATLVGYSDQATFSRAFNKWCGSTPDAVRRRTLNRYQGKSVEPA